MVKTKNCRVCSNEFVVGTGTAGLCSRPCKNAWARKNSNGFKNQGYLPGEKVRKQLHISKKKFTKIVKQLRLEGKLPQRETKFFSTEDVEHIKSACAIEYEKSKYTIADLARRHGISWGMGDKLYKEYNLENYTGDSFAAAFSAAYSDYIAKNSKPDDWVDYVNIITWLDLVCLENNTPKNLENKLKHIFAKYGEPADKKHHRVKNTYKCIWPKQRVQEWIFQIQAAYILAVKTAMEKKEQKKQRKLLEQQEAEEAEQHRAGYVTKTVARKLLYNNRNEEIVNLIEKYRKKINGRDFYLLEGVQQIKYLLDSRREEKKQVTKQNLKEKINAKVIRRKDDWRSDIIYDDKLWKRITLFGIPKQYASSELLVSRWKTNYSLIEDRVLRGIVANLDCNLCNQSKPYYAFYMEIGGGNKYGRRGQCRDCERLKKNKKTRIKKYKNSKTYLSQFISFIRKDLNKRNNQYIDLSCQEIWANLEKYCDYTKEDLIAHIESNFLPWMNWSNNGRPDKQNMQTWQLDHIVPRSKFNYSSMSDPDFISCWSLNNLRPIEAVMNLIKSDHDFMKKCASSFRRGLNEPSQASYIWKYLPYTPEEARTHLEKNYNNKIDWEAFKNSNLQVDHVVPQAFLSFTSFQDPNFIKCWALENLDLKIKQENSSKGSYYEGKIYFYNKIENKNTE